jgi:hypothetical protein
MFVCLGSRVRIFVVRLGANSESVPLLVLSAVRDVADVVLLRITAKRTSELLSQSEARARVYRSSNHVQIYSMYMRTAQSRIYSESSGIVCLRDSLHTWRIY